MLNAITWSETHVAQLFTGHRGSGKSTELLRLQARLEEAGRDTTLESHALGVLRALDAHLKTKDL
jgi:hypothetical protein